MKTFLTRAFVGLLVGCSGINVTSPQDTTGGEDGKIEVLHEEASVGPETSTDASPDLLDEKVHDVQGQEDLEASPDLEFGPEASDEGQDSDDRLAPTDSAEDLPPDIPSVQCASNSDCDVASYCKKSSCFHELGQCTKKPTLCPKIYQPVCGCNKKTYDNDCFAALDGQNILRNDECNACFNNSECDEDSFCEKNGCGLDLKGTCSKKPTFCPTTEDYVCGCEGIQTMDFKNACLANQAGFNVAHKGLCQNFCPSPFSPCSDWEYCKKTSCDLFATGTCTPKPNTCPPISDPVCTCDNVTYNNECLAAMAGQNVKEKGPCK